jgi:hypothetical protein
LNLSRCVLDVLEGAILDGCDFDGVNLGGKSLKGASVVGATFAGALNLSRCALDNLRGAILTGCDLTGVDLTGVDLTGTKGLQSALSAMIQGSTRHVVAPRIKHDFPNGYRYSMAAGTVVWHEGNFYKATTVNPYNSDCWYFRAADGSTSIYFYVPSVSVPP